MTPKRLKQIRESLAQMGPQEKDELIKNLLNFAEIHVKKRSVLLNQKYSDALFGLVRMNEKSDGKSVFSLHPWVGGWVLKETSLIGGEIKTWSGDSPDEVILRAEYDDRPKKYSICPECDGYGYWGSLACKRCGGTGKVENNVQED